MDPDRRPPRNDAEAYRRYPFFRRWYHKPLLYDRLGVRYGIFPELPERWPVLAKPVVNLEGVAAGVRLCHTRRELEAAPGCVWLPIFKGPHLSMDIDLDGTVMAAEAAQAPGVARGVFQHWKRADLPPAKQAWAREILGLLDPFRVVDIVNLEAIGDVVIEAHARPSHELRPLFEGACRYCVPIWAMVERPGFDIGSLVVACDHVLVSTMEYGEPEVGPPGWFRYGLLYGNDLKALRAAAVEAGKRIEGG